MLNQKTVKELLDYDAETGILKWRYRDRKYFKSDRDWKIWNTRYAGKVALANPNVGGYGRGRLFGKGYLARHVIWLWMKGEWSNEEIEHINCNPSDRRWGNLRKVSFVGSNKKLDAKTVRELLDYDPETGVLTWRQRDRKWFKSNCDWQTWNTRFAGKPSSTTTGGGYQQCTLFYKMYPAHRIIWFYMTEDWPADEIDHINRNRSDNRWKNLREATSVANRHNMSPPRNNPSGFVGIRKNKIETYTAQITVNGRELHLGTFQTLEDALLARWGAEKRYGFAPGHGSNTQEQRAHFQRLDLLWHERCAAHS